MSNSLLEEVHQAPAELRDRKDFPVQAATFTESLNGKETELAIYRYSDRILVIVTRIGKPGTFLEVTRKAASQTSDEKKFIYSSNVLLGKQSETYDLIGRALAEQLNLETPLVLALGFKTDLSPDDVKSIVGFVKSKW